MHLNDAFRRFLEQFRENDKKLTMAFKHRDDTIHQSEVDHITVQRFGRLFRISVSFPANHDIKAQPQLAMVTHNSNHLTIFPYYYLYIYIILFFPIGRLFGCLQVFLLLSPSSSPALPMLSSPSSREAEAA